MTEPGRPLPALLSILLLATTSLAQETSAPARNAESSDQEALIRKGDTEWGLLAGFGLASNAGKGFGDRQFLPLGGRVGRVLTNRVGPGLLKGHFEISLDVIPLFLTVQDNVAYGFNVGLLFRHYMRLDATMRPFVSFGSGPLVSTEQVPVGTSRFNFASSLGAGVLFRKSERAAYMIEARVHHISNADTADTNPGINSIYFQFGISFFR